MNTLSRKEKEKKLKEKIILDAAQKQFAINGYSKASMNKIAKEAEFTKRTIYQYFENKVDLYLTVALRFYKSFLEHLEEIELDEKNNFENIKKLFFAFFNFFKENENNFRIIYDIGKIRHETDNQKLEEYLKIDETIANQLEKLIIEGQEDGSVNRDLNPKLVTRSLMFLLISFFNQLTIVGKTYSKHIGEDLEKFTSYTLDLLSSTLK